MPLRPAEPGRAGIGKGRGDGVVAAVLLIGVWVLVQFLSLGAVAEPSAGGVAYAAHVGGFIFGTVTARLFESRQRLTG